MKSLQKLLLLLTLVSSVTSISLASAENIKEVLTVKDVEKKYGLYIGENLYPEFEKTYCGKDYLNKEGLVSFNQWGLFEFRSDHNEIINADEIIESHRNGSYRSYRIDNRLHMSYISEFPHLGRPKKGKLKVRDWSMYGSHTEKFTLSYGVNRIDYKMCTKMFCRKVLNKSIEFVGSDLILKRYNSNGEEIRRLSCKYTLVHLF